MTSRTGSTRTGRLGLRRLQPVGGVCRARGWGAVRSLAGNTAVVRVVGGYVLFTLTQYSAWVAMLVYAYRHGGAALAGLVAVAQLGPAAVLAPVAAAVADRRSAVVAHTTATVYKPDREPFLTAVSGHPPTKRQADRIANARLATGAALADGGMGDEETRARVLAQRRNGWEATNGYAC